MKAVIFNGSLKKDENESNTNKVIDLVIDEFKQYGIECKVVYLRDYRIAPGVAFDTGDSWDEAKQFYKDVEQADIVMLASPIWWGIHSSLIQALMERLGAYDDTYIETNKSPLYNKCFGVIATASNDGFQHLQGILLTFATNMGMTIPPESTITWGTVLEHSKGGKDPKKNSETMNMIKNTCRNLYLWSKTIKKLKLGSVALKIKPGRVGVLSTDKLKEGRK